MEIEKTICQRIASVAQLTLAEWGSAFSDVTINGVNGVNVTISVPGFATVLKYWKHFPCCIIVSIKLLALPY